MKEINEYLEIVNIENRLAYANNREHECIKVPFKTFSFLKNEAFNIFQKFNYIQRVFFAGYLYDHQYKRFLSGLSFEFNLESFCTMFLKNHFDTVINFRGVDLSIRLVFNGFSINKHSYQFNVFDIRRIPSTEHGLQEELQAILDAVFEEKISTFPFDTFLFQMNEVINGERPITKYSRMVFKDNEKIFESEINFFVDRITYNSNLSENLNIVLTNPDFHLNTSRMSEIFNVNIEKYTLKHLKSMFSPLHMSTFRLISEYEFAKSFEENIDNWWQN